MPSPGLRVAVAESLSRDLVKVNEWCDLCGMKLNVSKTKTMIVSRSRTMHPQLSALTIGGTVLKESKNLVMLGVTFDSKMTFEKHLRCFQSSFSTAWYLEEVLASILIDCFLGDALGVLSCQFWSTVLPFGARLPNTP